MHIEAFTHSLQIYFLHFVQGPKDFGLRALR